MPQPDLSRYAGHSRWTEPDRFGAQLDVLPAEAVRLPEIVSGLVLHPLFAPPGSDMAGVALRSVADILTAVLARDPRPLGVPREPGERLLVSCRSYALLACAILRRHDVPARLRVGFADYFTPDFSEDHWLCEYHDGDKWRLLDAELTEEVRGEFGIEFDPTDVPRDRFLAAGPAWQAMRRGNADPLRFGVSALGLSGLWFAASSLLRDLAALAMEETMPWDHWGPARDFQPGVEIPADWLARLDSLADRLAREPAGLDEVRSIGVDYPWAALTPTILSFPEGIPVEVSIAR